MKKMNYELSEDEHQKFKEKCGREGVKMKNVVAALIKYYTSNGITAENKTVIKPPNNDPVGLEIPSGN